MPKGPRGFSTLALHRSRTRRPTVFLAAALALSMVIIETAPSPAGGATRARRSALTISGVLNVSGYSVVALGFNGRFVVSNSRRFSLVAPDRRVTLQLISPKGVYAGPLVVGRISSKKVIVGVRAGTKLGKIVYLPAKGYARLARQLASSALISSRWAWARRGVPLGNGRNLGLVVSPTTKGGATGPGGDTARDGVPNSLDIAVPGTLTINALAPVFSAKLMSAGLSAHRASTGPVVTTGTAGSTTNPPASGIPSPWMSQMFLGMNQTVNDDAAGITQAEIDATLSANLDIKLLNVPTSASLVELSCGKLTYCSANGSGMAALEGLAPVNGGYTEVAFPGTALDPQTGAGEIVGPLSPAGLLGMNAGSNSKEFGLAPNAASPQIGSGDVITILNTTGGNSSQTASTINFVFDTVPAIASYTDTGGDSGAISYPDVSGLGTMNNPIRLAAGSNGDVVVTFSFWRPQRAGIVGANESAYMDIGHLWYSLDYAATPTPGQTTVGGATAPQCPTTTYSNPSTGLSLTDGGSVSGGLGAPAGTGMLVDSAGDLPASASNVLSFTVDLSACVVHQGQTLGVGQPYEFDLSANSQNSHDHSNQQFWIERTK